jgi:hypothetical protein
MTRKTVTSGGVGPQELSSYRKKTADNSVGKQRIVILLIIVVVVVVV